jgi:hypothetical protein
MPAQTETTEQNAAKKHRCSWCGESIDVGESYKRYRYFDGGDVGTVKMHPECYEDMLECASYEGGWIEWGYGSCERPERAAQQSKGDGHG